MGCPLVVLGHLVAQVGDVPVRSSKQSRRHRRQRDYPPFLLSSVFPLFFHPSFPLYLPLHHSLFPAPFPLLSSPPPPSPPPPSNSNVFSTHYIIGLGCWRKIGKERERVALALSLFPSISLAIHATSRPSTLNREGEQEGRGERRGDGGETMEEEEEGRR